MRTSRHAVALLLTLLVLMLLVVGCGSTRLQPGRSSFSFAHDGSNYEIVSTVLQEGVGYNLLVLRDRGLVAFRARDDDQDGVLDTLLAGDLTLEEANVVYTAGIEAARAGGRYRKMLSVLIFELSRPEGSYAVQTHTAVPGVTKNRFVVVRIEHGQKLTLLDAGADGILDRVERGACELAEVQKAYEMVLAEGVRQGRIEHVQNQYLVRAR